MSNQHTSQEEVSNELKKSITPMSEEEIDRAKGVEGHKEGCCNQKDENRVSNESLKNN